MFKPNNYLLLKWANFTKKKCKMNKNILALDQDSYEK